MALFEHPEYGLMRDDNDLALPAGTIKCDECDTIYLPMTDSYTCPTCGEENYPQDEGEK